MNYGKKKMNKKEFIEQFTTTWLATWSATNWADYCIKDMHEKLMKPPVEEAFFLANEAWNHIENIFEDVV